MVSEWCGHDESGQRDIVAALGEQTRVALTMLRDKLGAGIEMDWDAAARALCAEEVIAKAMRSLQIQAYFRLGFTLAKIAAMCRQ